MKIPTLFKKYIWLIETINRAGKISFADINKKWQRKEESGGVEFSRTTFNRHPPMRSSACDTLHAIPKETTKVQKSWPSFNVRGNSACSTRLSTTMPRTCRRSPTEA